MFSGKQSAAGRTPTHEAMPQSPELSPASPGGFEDDPHLVREVHSHGGKQRYVASFPAAERLIADGATEILSIHIADSLSGTLNSSRLAAQRLSIPIRHVDTGIASFGISCCAWAAAEAIADGADLEAAAIVAEDRAARLGTAFVAGIPLLAERSGRADGLGLAEAADSGIPVIAMSGGEIEVLATVDSLHEAVAAMAAYALGWTASLGSGLRIAVGTSDETSVPVARSLTELLEHNSDVAEIVQYRIGPTVGAHTGPGTAGLFVF